MSNLSIIHGRRLALSKGGGQMYPNQKFGVSLEPDPFAAFTTWSRQKGNPPRWWLMSLRVCRRHGRSLSKLSSNN